jgi:hypothetical protein
MKTIAKTITQLGVIWLICFGLLSLQPAWAASNISETFKHAWSENAGWLNWRSTHAPATVGTTYLTGHVWAENIGWIKLGSTPSGGTYPNTTSTNWGVNRDKGTGALSGYAWSENAGWINFNPTDSEVSIDPSTGEFDGYAWGENVGWIHFKSPDELYGVVTDYRGRPPASVPTLNQWSMIALVLLLGILAVRMMKRGRKDAIMTI